MKKFLILLFLLLPVSAFISCSDGGEEGTSLQPGYDYNTPEEVLAFLDEITLNYSGITKLESVGAGLSEEGRPIRGIVISDNPGTLEGEPAIRLTGGIHGSEMISVELMIRFIEYLTSNYGISSEVTDLIDNRYIVIIPVLNPDGLSMKTRYNSRSVDLNRNFSYQWSAGTSHGVSALSELESQAMISFSQSNIFHLSATFHSGEVLLNMPFDYDSEIDGTKPVENTLVRSYGKAYTMAGIFLNNPDLYQSVYMEDGVINGGNWYEISGSLQDWSYKETGCLDMTIEVALRNPSTEAGVQQVFEYNRYSLLAYIEKAGYGVHGRVTDSVTGLPVSGIQVGISGGDIITKTDSEGFYYRILLPGDYTLTFRHSDYNNLDEAVTVPDSTNGLTKNVAIIHK